MVDAAAAAIISLLLRFTVALPPALMLSAPAFSTSGEAALAAAVTVAWPVPERLRPAKCWFDANVTLPPVAVMVNEAVDALPASLANVALPAVLMNVVPLLQVCGPLWLNVPLLVLA